MIGADFFKTKEMIVDEVEDLLQNQFFSTSCQHSNIYVISPIVEKRFLRYIDQ